MPKKRLVLTFATGHRQYHTMTKALAISIRAHCSQAQLAIITDQPGDPETRALFDVILPPPTDFSHWFIKLCALKYTEADHILFIDGDGIAMRNIDPIFDALEGKDFAVQGRWVEGLGHDWYGDFDSVMKREGVTRASKFSGGFLYYERTENAERLIEEILRYRDRYDELGLRRNGGHIVDEVCIALAMGKLGIGHCEPDDSQFSDTPWYRVGKVELDVAKGIARWPLLTPNGLRLVQPAIYHTATARWDLKYWREVRRLLRWWRTSKAPWMQHDRPALKAEMKFWRVVVLLYRKLYLGGD